MEFSFLYRRILDRFLKIYNNNPAPFLAYQVVRANEISLFCISGTVKRVWSGFYCTFVSWDSLKQFMFKSRNLRLFSAAVTTEGLKVYGDTESLVPSSCRQACSRSFGGICVSLKKCGPKDKLIIHFLDFLI